MITAFRDRLVRVPKTRDWAEMLGLLAIFSVTTLAVSLIFGKDAVFSSSGPNVSVWLFLPVSFFIPSLFEEAVFRGLFQPAGHRGAQRALLLALSIGVFVLWHPVQVWLGLPMAQSLLLQLPFLTLVAVLGACATIMVQRSGSLWTPVVFHWCIVVVWKLLSGGST